MCYSTDKDIFVVCKNKLLINADISRIKYFITRADPLISEIIKPNGRISYSLYCRRDGVTNGYKYVAFICENVITHFNDGIKLTIDQHYRDMDESVGYVYHSIKQGVKLDCIKNNDIHKYNMLICVRILHTYTGAANIMRFIIALGKEAIDIYKNGSKIEI
jgi:hypothetical protein